MIQQDPPVAPRTRAELVKAAGEVIRKGSKSFHTASKLFDPVVRERAWLLYCWCRYCDDQCDGQTLGHRDAEAARRDVVDLEAGTARALSGENTGVLAFDALATVARECRIPERFISDHLRGFALDSRGWKPKNEADLLQYCYYVAGAVGCMMAVIMGVDPDDESTLTRAAHLGTAFQLANIARDVRDDHESGRCYLPASWLRDFGVDPENPMKPEQRERLVALVKQLTHTSEIYETSAREGVAALGFRSRWAVLAAAGIYGRIGRRVAGLGSTAWDERVVVPKQEKLSIMMGAFARALFR